MAKARDVAFASRDVAAFMFRKILWREPGDFIAPVLLLLCAGRPAANDLGKLRHLQKAPSLRVSRTSVLVLYDFEMLINDLSKFWGYTMPIKNIHREGNRRLLNIST